MVTRGEGVLGVTGATASLRGKPIASAFAPTKVISLGSTFDFDFRRFSNLTLNNSVRAKEKSFRTVELVFRRPKGC